MAFTVDPPKKRGRHSRISAAVLKMERKTDLFFPNGNASSIRSIVSHIAKDHKREYQTATEDGGVRVWRHK
jgi:hypothetical protein